MVYVVILFFLPDLNASHASLFSTPFLVPFEQLATPRLDPGPRHVQFEANTIIAILNLLVMAEIGSEPFKYSESYVLSIVSLCLPSFCDLLTSMFFFLPLRFQVKNIL